MDFAQNLLLVADVTVREETNEPQALRVVGRIQCRLDPLNHHRAAFTLERSQISEASANVFR